MGNGNTLTKLPRRKVVALAIVNENQEIQDAIRLKAYEIYLEYNVPGKLDHQNAKVRCII